MTRHREADARRKVLVHFTMSLDGFVAGPQPRDGLDGRDIVPSGTHR